MTFNKVNMLIQEDSDLAKFMSGIEPMSIKLPVLVDQILEIISDDGVYVNYIKDSNIVSLCKLCRRITSRLAGIDAFNEAEHIKRACEYSNKAIYYIDINGRNRIATKNEIKTGATGLYTSVENVAGERSARLLHILQWIITGYSSYIYRIGYEIKWNKEGEIQTTVYDMIVMAAAEIEEALQWYGSDEYKKAIRIIEKFIKAYKNLYPKSAADEVKERISVEQIAKDIKEKNIPYTEDKDIRKAKALAASVLRGDKVKPIDIAFMRKQYDKVCNDGTTTDEEVTVNNSVKEMCDKIEEEVKSGKLSKDTFALRIIDTIKVRGYNVSEKQYKVISNTYDKITIEENEEDKEQGIKDISREDYSGIGDILEI